VTNILLISSDQQHWNTLGCLNPEIQTPNLDRLAQRGKLFTRAYCPNPTCTPTRASMITGKYPSQHGAYSLGTKLPETEPTLGGMLQQSGYETSLIGKAHFQPLASTNAHPSLESYPTLQNLDFWRDFDGPFYGFDHIELSRNHTDEAHVGQHYALWLESKGLDNWREHFQPPTGHHPKQRHRWTIPEEYHYNSWIVERSNHLLEQYAQAEQPFFLWSSFFDPHPSYLVPEPWDTMYDPTDLTLPQVTEGEHYFNPPHFRLAMEPEPDFTFWTDEPGGHPGLQGMRSHFHDRDELARDMAVYYGMISCMDRAIGSILNKLDETGLAEDTVVVFTSDHGHFFGQHGLIRKGPFHYEDMIRVPLIAALPGRIPSGQQSDALQSLVDLPQTLLNLCGIDLNHNMTGVDQTPTWTGEQSTSRHHLIVENHHQPKRLHLKTYVNQRYKLTIYLDQPDGELFDIEHDPNEIHNRWYDANYLTLKHQLLEQLLYAEIEKEELLTADTAALPQKSAQMYTKCVQDGTFELRYDHDAKQFWLIDTERQADSSSNLWEHPSYRTLRYEMIRQLLFQRMRNEPLWMPRIHGA